MGSSHRVPRRGEVYSIDPNPTLGKETTGRHHWLILTEEEVNRHGMAIAVVINTVANGMRSAGLAVQVSAGSVTGVAVLNQVRSFDMRARDEETGVAYQGTADPAVVADIATRVASLIDPEPPPPPPPRGRGKATGSAEEEGSLGAALKKAIAKKESPSEPKK